MKIAWLIVASVILQCRVDAKGVDVCAIYKMALDSVYKKETNEIVYTVPTSGLEPLHVDSSYWKGGRRVTSAFKLYVANEIRKTDRNDVSYIEKLTNEKHHKQSSYSLSDVAKLECFINNNDCVKAVSLDSVYQLNYQKSEACLYDGIGKVLPVLY
jgi:hypothetical protein